MSLDENLRKAVSFTVSAGYQLDKEAFDFLSSISKTTDPIEFMEKVIKKAQSLSEKPVFLNREFLEKIAEETLIVKEADSSLISQAKRMFKPLAKEITPDIKIIEDPTEKISATGSMEEYLKHFRDRFSKLEKILRQRIDVRDAVSIRDAYKASVNAKLKIIGMVTEKRESKKRILLRLEDLEAAVTVLVPSNVSRETLERARSILLDQVICVSVRKARNNLLIAEDVIWPDIPKRKPRTATEPVYAALISDLHVGSKTFMRKEFNNFLLWLNGKYGNSKLMEIAGKVKYLVIAGDIVDGIGVYPQQVKELAIKDISKQYELASEYFEQIPDYIEVIVIPGNHDASRKALPQPAIPKEYAEAIYEKREIYSLGDPATVRLHGVEVLIYHGRSLDDVIVNSPNANFDNPQKAMKLLLQCRHLAPTYGERTPIAPEPRDFLVIERVPDIFHAGHVHVLGYENYRGTLIINSGAWQRQTAYQKKMGLKPTPGIAPIVNLQSLEVISISFSQ